MEVVSQLFGWVDTFYPLLVTRKAKQKTGDDRPLLFFKDGYGDVEKLKACEDKYLDIGMGKTALPELSSISVENSNEESSWIGGDYRSELWIFKSPMAEFLPVESESVYCEYVKPTKQLRAVVIILPGTGDKYFTFRRNLVSLWLLRYGIASLIVMAPGYGKRRPAGQRGHFIDTVSLVMRNSCAIMIEAAALATRVRKDLGVPVVLSGMSWGGAMAAGASLFVDGPIGVVPSVGCPSAQVFATGIIQIEVDWIALAVEDGSQSEDDAKGKLKDFLGSRSLVHWPENAGLMNAAAERNKKGLRICYSITAQDDAFVPLQDGLDLHRSMKVLFSAGVDPPPPAGSDDAGRDGERSTRRQCESVQHCIVGGGHASTILGAPFILVPEIVRIVDALTASST